MNRLDQPERLGIGSPWPTRKAVIKRLRAPLPRTKDRIAEYNARLDIKNTSNVVESLGYAGLGHDFEAESIALAMEEKPWLPVLARATGYLLFHYKIDYF